MLLLKLKFSDGHMTFTCWSHDTAIVKQEVEEEVGPAVEQQLKESHEREQEMNAHIQRLESQLERVSQSPDKIMHFDVTTSLYSPSCST